MILRNHTPWTQGPHQDVPEDKGRRCERCGLRWAARSKRSADMDTTCLGVPTYRRIEAIPPGLHFQPAVRQWLLLADPPPAVAAVLIFALTQSGGRWSTLPLSAQDDATPSRALLGLGPRVQGFCCVCRKLRWDDSRPVRSLAWDELEGTDRHERCGPVRWRYLGRRLVSTRLFDPTKTEED